jgi:hypothetical protein
LVAQAITFCVALASSALASCSIKSSTLPPKVLHSLTVFLILFSVFLVKLSTSCLITPLCLKPLPKPLATLISLIQPPSAKPKANLTSAIVVPLPLILTSLANLGIMF